MKKIVTHPLFCRAKRVVDSCQTEEQLEVARKYVSLAMHEIEKGFKTGISYEDNGLYLTLRHYKNEILDKP